MDDLLDKGKREGDIDLRKDYYKQAQEKLVDLAPMLYTHHTIELTGVSNKVDGFWVNSNGVFMIQNATLSE